ncbi:hypothetical protein [Chitinophaga rhizophila]|uniref:DUF4595 domain-containing protein n=1 Tax=Chitinophaga rhizophila TaxID=2866212 RepID=A0ABS7GLL9_9BACT|nr:hypothetical protein [Chitinophaga rhizophila]MBW8688371.1 hypothetical protein [Chitinophaga rhizophila]
MKMKLLASLLLLSAMTAFTACSKDEETKTEPEVTGSSLFVRMQQGVEPGRDTIYGVKYDAQQRIEYVYDSSFETGYKSVYNAAGQLESIVEEGPFAGGSTINFSYNEGNQLNAIVYSGGGYRYRYEFTYKDGVISQSRFYQNVGDGGAPSLSSISNYEVTDGNITNIKRYAADNVLKKETTLTYTAHENVFKPFVLLNMFARMGYYDLADVEHYFNKNLVSGATSGTILDVYVYTYNDKKQLIKSVSLTEGRILTRFFAY